MTADQQCGELAIARRLGHAVNKKSDVIVPSITGCVYLHSTRMKEQQAVLDKVAAELRRIVGPRPVDLRLAA